MIIARSGGRVAAGGGYGMLAPCRTRKMVTAVAETSETMIHRRNSFSESKDEAILLQVSAASPPAERMEKS
ncbi:hypothetical protein CU669_17075 [Paramagnetospirillum kuznetsovii]|uniref:Uncharacterized protein n=1 Tax=Paramagnetospirillum kuznetsovii TaxID=2053833 RepID=A0A364NUS1_9PROT|nr:hypothetical protein CU669_17075 [Paramagnetospirillum kuznetsovii]